MMISEWMLLSFALCGVLTVFGLKFRSLPILVVSSLGLVIISLDVIEGGGTLLNAALIWTLAFGQVLLGART